MISYDVIIILLEKVLRYLRYWVVTTGGRRIWVNTIIVFDFDAIIGPIRNIYINVIGSSIGTNVNIIIDIILPIQLVKLWKEKKYKSSL